MSDARKLSDLVSVGPAALRDFERLGVSSVAELAGCDSAELYERLCAVTAKRHDPCVRDVFDAAIAQANDPDLPLELRQWWTYSRRRKAAASLRDDGVAVLKAKRIRLSRVPPIAGSPQKAAANPKPGTASPLEPLTLEKTISTSRPR